MKRSYLLLGCFLVFLCCREKKLLPEKDARFTTRDGVILTGDFFPPSRKEKVTFILLHGLGSSRREWDDFTERLRKRGYGCLAYDLRGHGESTKKEYGKEVDYRKFLRPGPLSEWSLMVEDLGQAVKYLKRKGIRKQRIGLMGASLGANIALLYTSKERTLPLTVLLSPGWNYAGLDTTLAIREYGVRPLALVASPKDSYAYQTSVLMHRIVSQNNPGAVFLKGKGGEHGVQMLKGRLKEQLLKWIEEQAS